jgi:PBP1b-binding outer membrane lipoprotein LpoB
MFKNMKKLIWILLSIFLLQGCSIREGWTIEKVNEYNNTVSLYTANNINFYARKGLYNVGDTIKFTK